MKLSSVIAGAAFFTTSFGAPTAANNIFKGRAPPAPPGPPPPPPPAAPPPPPTSEADVRSHIKSVGKDTCLFYSEVGSENHVKAVRDGRDYLKGYQILKERWTDQSWPDEAKLNMPGSGKGRKFFDMASRVFARECSGTVYVLLPADTSGTDWDQNKVWNLEEWPNLPPVVTKVVRLRKDDPSYKEVIWGSSTKRNVAPIKARAANDKCAISLNQWDNDRTDGPGDRFDLEFDVHNDKGVVLRHQARVSVGDWNPLRLLSSSLLTRIIVIPNGDSVGF